MGERKISKDNHYVSQAYLSNWESSPEKVYVYRILVSHENVPIWEEKSIKGIAYHKHLYTQQLFGFESDNIEQWFSIEFESPAESSIQKAISEDRLTPDDWYKLVRFLAMHDVRTPGRLAEYLKINVESTRESLEEIIKKLHEKFENIEQSGVAITADNKIATFPLKVTAKINEGEEFGTLKVETAVGRASWLWVIQHLLNNTAKVLHQHKWTIMRPALGMSWFTTDKPVIRLNYYSPGKYDFKGGWGSNGSEIFLPLSPEHMLYTRIGHRQPKRGSRFSIEHTSLLRQLIAEHAHRYVFGKAVDNDVPIYIPRTINAKFYQQEHEQWERWHLDQTESEKYLLSRGIE